MAERFNLTAQLNLQAPNTGKVASQIRRDLGNVKVPVNIQADAKALAQTQGQLKNIDKGARQASKSMNFFNKNLAEAARRFSVITVATGSFIALTRAVKNSLGAAIEFERELVRISQVTGKSVDELKGLQAEVTRLSTSLGVANDTLLQTARVLAQAGLSAAKTKQALQVLANTTLAPSFDNIIDTTEGAIAILNQFGRQAAKTGQDIKFLEQSLDAINQVSKNFAVESADLISAVRRTGGVFQAAGGNINELIALFTSVRQTTRESAETIATGFRTIFTRLQRKDTIEALNELGIALQDAEGKFVGPLKAIQRLAVGLAGLDPKDVRFNEIVEQLGGFRQIGKVIPLIKQYSVAQNALSVANQSAGSTAKDAQTAQQSLAVQFTKTQQAFDSLLRKFAESDTFQDLATDALKIANAFLKFAESLEKILPQLTAIAGIKLGKALAPGLLGLFGGKGKNAGGKVLGFNAGGYVPGSGNRDTVPAMLTPGEFVIRKGSVQKLGAENLARMNEGRKKFALGGKASSISESKPFVFQTNLTKDKKSGTAFDRSRTRFNPDDEFIVQRAGDKTIDVNQYKSTTPGIKKYRAAVKKGDPRARGLAFEEVVTEINPNIKLADPGARIDAAGGTGQLYEIKSEKEALVDAKLNKKAVGGALNPLSSVTDQKLADRLTNTKLTGQPNKIDLGKVGVIQDITDTSKIGKEGEGTQDKLGAKIKKGARALQQRALGGLIQKFAAGGIVDQKSAGAAILDPAGSSSSSIGVSNADVKASFSEFKGLPKGKDPVSQFYKATNFSVAKSGLNKETSDKFKTILEDGLVAGINNSAAALSRDLGTPSATIAAGDTANFVRGINTSIFGRLYETVIESISNQGQFSGTDPNRPFDAEGGLPAGLKDNFSGLPSKFIDLKSSLNEASDKSFKGKIVDQIKRELIQDGILNADYPGKAGADKKRAEGQAKRQKEAAARTAADQGFADTVKKRRGLNKGGGISGKDTVPALLTPGEFVFSKSAAQSIGYGNLNRMNTQGVQGYNKGGTVGFRRYANGTGPTGVAGGGGGFDLGGIQAAIAELEASAQEYETAISAASKQIDAVGKKSAEGQAAIAAKIEAERALAATYEQLGNALDAQEFAELEAAEAKVAASLAAQDAELNALIEAEKQQQESAKRSVETQKKAEESQKKTLEADKQKAEAARKLAEADTKAAEQATTGAEKRGPGSRQPKKERIGPKPGDNIGAKAQAGLEAIAGEGVQLASAIKIYKAKVASGTTSQDALNQISSKASALISERNQTNQQLAAENEELTTAYSEVGNRTEEQATDMQLLNAQVKRQSEASAQVTDILLQWKENLASGLGKLDGLNAAIEQVTTEQGKSQATFDELRKSALQLAKEQKLLEQEEKKLETETKKEVKELQDSDPKESLDCKCPEGAGGGAGPGPGPEASDPSAGGSGDDGPDVPKAGQGLEKFSGYLSKAGSALNGVANAALAYTLIVGTLTQTSGELSEEEKRVAQAGNNAAAAFIGLSAQIGSLVLEVGSNILSTVATIKAKNAETGTTVGTTGAIQALGQAAATSAGQISGGQAGNVGGDLVSNQGGGKKGKGGRLGKSFKGGKGGGGLAAGAALTAGVTTTFAIMANEAKKTAEALEKFDIAIEKAAKTAEDELEKIGSGTGEVADEDKFVKARTDAVLKEQQKTARANEGARRSTAALAGGLLGTAAAVATAGIALQGIPIAGQIVGGILLGVAAAAAGAYLAINFFAAETERVTKLRAKATELTVKIVGVYARAQFRAAKAANELANSLQQAKDQGLSLANQTRILASDFNKAATTLEQNEAATAGQEGNIAELERTLEGAGLLRRSSTTGELVEDKEAIKDADAEASDQFDQLKQFKKQLEDTAKAQAELKKQLIAQKNAFKQLAKESIGEVVNNLENFDIATLASVSSLDDLKLQNRELGLAAQQATQKFAEALQLQFRDERKEAEDAGDEPLKKAIDNRIAAEVALFNATNKLVAAERILASQQTALATAKSNRAELQKQKILLQTNRTLGVFQQALAQTAGGAAFKAVDTFADRDRFGGGTFDAIEIDTTALEIPLGQLNNTSLKTLQSLSKISFDGQEALQGDGQTFSDRFAALKKLSSNIAEAEATFKRTEKVEIEVPKAVRDPKTGELTISETQTEKRKTNRLKDLPQQEDELFAALTQGLGQVDPQFEKLLRNRIEEALASNKGKVDLSKIRDDLEEQFEAQKDILKANVEALNAYNSKLNKVNNSIINAQEKVTDAFTKVAEVSERSADRQEKLFGGGRSRADKEVGRRRVAQQALGPTASGRGAVAGDVASTRRAALGLANEATAKRKRAQQAEEAIRSGAAPADETSAEKIAELNKQAGEAAKGAARAKNELERLADQSSRAADLEEELNNLRQKQSQIQSLQEDIAFGSDDQRAQIGQDFNVLQQAIAQGGIQGANEDQRAGVARALDSISDQVLTFEGQQVTGKELKAIFAARATGQLGAGSINDYLDTLRAAENPLQAELNKIAAEELAAAEALAELAQSEVSELQGLRADLKTFPQELAAALKAQSAEKAKEETAVDKEIAKEDANIVKLTDAILGAVDPTSGKRTGGTTEAVKNLTEAQKKAEKALVANTEALNKERETKNQRRELRDKDVEKAAGVDLTELRKLENRAATLPSFDRQLEQDESKKVLETFGTSEEVIARDQAGAKELGVSFGFRQGSVYSRGGFDRESTALQEGDFGNDSELENITDATDLRQATFAAFGDGFTQAIEQIRSSNLNDGVKEALIGQVKQAFEDSLTDLQDLQKSEDVNDKNRAANTQITGFGDIISKNLTPAIKEFREEALKFASVPSAKDLPVDGKAMGGLIYRAGGGSIFQPKGTDTVPAMLTPGEFVIRKSAVDKIGASNLAALNNGGATVYRQGGGLVPAGAVQQAVTQIFSGKGGARIARKSFEGAGYEDAGKLTSALFSLGKKGAITPDQIDGIKRYEDLLAAFRNQPLIKDFEKAVISPPDFSNIATQDFQGALQGRDQLNKYFNSLQNTLQAAQNASAELDDDGNPKNNTARSLKFIDKVLVNSKLAKESPLRAVTKVRQAIAKQIGTYFGAKFRVNQAYEKLQAAGDDPAKVAPAKQELIAAVFNAKKRADAEVVGQNKDEQEAKAQALKGGKKAGGTGTGLSARQQGQLDLLRNEGVLRLAQGGGVGGQDSVPAMLTPGEFVMSPESVRKYGVGYMKNLNRGRVPGFRRGGLVASGPVAYRANGGEAGSGASLMIDTANLQGVLSEFSASFQTGLDNVVAEFSNLSGAMNNLAAAIGSGMQVNHQFSGDMSLAFKLENAETLKTAVAEAMTPVIVEKITTEINRRLDGKSFKSQ